ncbi:MAG: DUF2971 domain-containing protein [Promethearchaeota archaeon]
MQPLTDQTILKPSDHPRIIYKFRDWKKKYHRKILTRREIYIPSPKEFNDPFDCRIPESFFMLNTDDKIEKYITGFVNRNLEYFQDKKIDIPNYVAFLKKDLKENTSIYQGKLNQIYLREGDLHFGIFSAAKIWDNILMWAHYSANHSGFCIGFNREKLYDSLPSTTAASTTAASVMYMKKFPLIDPFDDFVQKMFQKSHTKAINWKYEKEYRFFVNSYPDELSLEKRRITIAKDCFSCIMIGLNFPTDQISVIKRLSDKLEVPLYQIYIADRAFKIKRKKINLI